MTNAKDALAAAEAGADAIGLIFAPSKRRVTVERAKEITRELPQGLERVGVFYDEMADTIEEIAADVGLTAVQLHGEESADLALRLHRSQLKVFKTLHVTEGMATVAQDFLSDGCVDGLLFDTVIENPQTGAVERGGTGKTFDWRHVAEILPSIREQSRIVVAGGLSPENVGEAIRILQPWGVDVCSGVEFEPGKKNPDKIRKFVTAARS